MRRLVTGVAVAAALVSTAQPVLAEPQAAPSGYTDQEIRWKPCFPPGQPLPPELPPGSERLECGTLTAPQDWKNPGQGKDITISVTRLSPESGPTGRALFTNPGGPGGAGMAMPAAMLGWNRPKLMDNFDVYGIDVRGTGRSSTVSCGPQAPNSPLDPRDRSAESIRAQLAAVEEFAAACQEHSGELGRYVTTEQTVADLDLLRQVEGHEKVSWYGISGGTWLGAYYATYFPKTVDRFVLDSNTQFTGSWQEVFGWQPMAFERRWREDLRPWLAANDGSYHLGATPEAVQATVDELRAKLKANPIPPEVPGGPATDHNALDAMLLYSMYSKATFPQLGQTMAALRDGATGAAARSLSQAAARQLPMQQTPPAESMAGTLYSIRCNDTEFRGGPEFLERNSGVQGALFPFYGYHSIFQPCAYWNDRPDVQLREPTGEGLPPVLMLQSENDPATAVEGARIAHEQFAGSRLVTVADEGDHGLYGQGNACVDDLVESYLVDGVVPERDVTCRGLPLPGPQQAAVARPSLFEALEDLADALG
ncbi:alpha/beta hydrolase [Saccharopolyspora taberi]|uniref:Alpha/beta hydrolase n=1 Tax=Saccharopolyspora taberi TaxID=60895 RepID=A0ABN3VMT4_9PSEU